jgi:probable F420-dependent oxidoreductase
MAMRVGIGLFTGQVRPGSKRTFTQEYRDVVDLIRLAETVGFDSAWVSEHHGAGDGYLPSLLPILAAAAEATEHIGLGTGVILAPFHDPLRLAEDAAVVDLISGGRLTLGLGLGWREEEFRMFGVPPRERVARTVDAVEILRRAWTGERFSYEGRVHSVDRVQVRPAPERPKGGSIPILLGGHAEPAIRRAARLADGWIRSRAADVTTLEDMRRDLAVFDDAAAQAGREAARLPFVQIRSAFAWDEGDALAVVREGLAHATQVYVGWRQDGDTPDHGFLVPDTDDATLRRVAAIGTPHEVAHRLRPLADAFASRRDFTLVVRLQFPGVDYDIASHAVELFGEHVIPALKGA